MKHKENGKNKRHRDKAFLMKMVWTSREQCNGMDKQTNIGTDIYLQHRENGMDIQTTMQRNGQTNIQVQTYTYGTKKS